MSGSIAVLLAVVLFGSVYFVQKVEALDCRGATPSRAQLWPPNHKLVPITISGMTSNGQPVSIVITRITQDVPLDGDDEGDDDGDTTPDAFGVGTSTALLRAERRGSGNRSWVSAFRYRGTTSFNAPTVGPMSRSRPSCSP